MKNYLRGIGMLKYAIFDLDDTLLDFKKGERIKATEVLRKYGVQDLTTGLATYTKINQQVWEAIEQGAPRDQVLKTRFSKTFAALGVDGDGVAAEREYRQRLATSYYQFEGAQALLRDLKSAGIRLMVGTNGVKKTQLSRLAGSKLDQYFIDCFISEDVGYAKPDERFFAPIKHKYADMSFQNTAMVGDRLQSDILGANQAGFKSIWYNPQQIAVDAPIKPTAVAHSYDQLRELML
ncbi:HAD superfamily hydrolase [Pediococcus acidilactici]|mgnify:FL=1|uniref:HAD hydrolase, TIGR02254 family n=2 Tax=Pediococcus acidilactici TaxID=1254 RepID=E0NI08_PEDAC|nr:HAD hydrolase, TIGR02254 family [Pediococcus acidilactici DSM 20284]KRN15848.1 HAD superfamily hydrolase [Pediococcus acidilactici]